MVQRKNRNWIGYNKNDQVLMAVFLYNLYIFVWTSHSDLTYIPGASFINKDRTINLKMSVRSFLRSAYVGFTKSS